jgi:hypothetical protein
MPLWRVRPGIREISDGDQPVIVRDAPGLTLAMELLLIGGIARRGRAAVGSSPGLVRRRAWSIATRHSPIRWDGDRPPRRGQLDAAVLTRRLERWDAGCRALVHETISPPRCGGT